MPGSSKDNIPVGWKKAITAVSGGSVIVLGIIAVPAPGPGWLIIFAGLKILAKEFPWAQRLFLFGKGKYEYWEQWVRRQNWFVKSSVSLIAACAFAGMLWLSNVFGVINTVLSLDIDVLISPLLN